MSTPAAVERPGAPGPSTSDLIRAALAGQRLTAGRLAPVLGLSRAAVSRRMMGETDWTVGELLTVARFLGVAPAALLPELPAVA